MWVFIENGSEDIWTVGFYTPNGKWVPAKDFNNQNSARREVHYLNGGNDDQPADD